MNFNDKNTQDILNKYGAKLEGQVNDFDSRRTEKFSHSYESFRASMIPSFSRYEKWCKAFGSVFSIKVGEKDKARIQKSIDVAHLNVTPSEAMSLAMVVLIGVLLLGSLLVTAIYFLTGTFSTMFLFLVFLISVFMFFYASKSPERLALQWRLKASSQMVPAILYVVVYMKHTSNFEKAIAFASEHLEPPLALDFKKIFWDVEVGRYSTIKDSVDNYLESWRDYSMEFIEAFHLIESSLYEPSEARRVAVLEKSLQVILDGVYDKMLKYTHDVKSPLTNLYMLGIVLPTLSLAILPLASTMLGGAIKPYHVFLLFNVLIPFVVIYLTQDVLMKRPGGYGESRLLEKNPLYPKYASKKPYVLATLLMLPLLILGFLPIIWMYTPLPETLGMKIDYTWAEIGLSFMGSGGIFGIIPNESGTGYAGPFGAVSILLSLLVPLSIAGIFIIGSSMRTKELIKEREKYKQVEDEFTSSLFQLGNRIGDGLPAEIAFSKVASSTKGTATEGFYRMVNQNIQSLGMSLNEALFNSRRGAVVFYPSQLIATSMKVMVESVKKGLQVAARSLMSISDYVKNIKKINERLNDLLADIISDMKSNMTFLAPMLSGIVVGLAGMITTILGGLEGLLASTAGDSSILESAGGVSGLLGIFNLKLMLSTYWLQIAVGLYLIEIVFILTGTLVTINSGRDELQKTAEIGNNLKKSIIFYIIVSLGAIIGLSLIAAVALSGLGA